MYIPRIPSHGYQCNRQQPCRREYDPVSYSADKKGEPMGVSKEVFIAFREDGDAKRTFTFIACADPRPAPCDEYANIAH